MTHAEKGAKGGTASADTRLVQGREHLLRCKTQRELLAEVKALEDLAYGRGYSTCEAKWLRRMDERLRSA